MRLVMLVVGGLLLTTGAAWAQDATVARFGFPRPKRKLIVYGWELGFRFSRLARRLLGASPFFGQEYLPAPQREDA